MYVNMYTLVYACNNMYLAVYLHVSGKVTKRVGKGMTM